MSRPLLPLSLLALLGPLVSAQSPQGRPVEVGPQAFQRCGTPAFDPEHPALWMDTGGGGKDDCLYGSSLGITDPSYDPTFVYEIPVVFHVIQTTTGEGFVSPTQVQSQIDVLNEDFRALVGSSGEPGTDTRIQFHLATVDPVGNPTNGITYSMNDQWFADNGQYFLTLAWDTNRYLNIYSNGLPGSLGYVPSFPQGGWTGLPALRAVVKWSTVGKDAPFGAPWDQGRITTHEVGHYLGLWHTFDGGCGTADCYGTGDRICDTNPQQGSTNGCPPSKTSCGSLDPIHNYMDYTDDACIWEFTPEQANRMRCTLENWLPDLWTRELVVPYGCNVNPAGSLVQLGGDPIVGSSVFLGLDNPGGTQGNAVTALVVSATPDPAFPCGSLVPGWGMGAPGSNGEVLVDLAAPVGTSVTFAGPTWTAGGPVSIEVPIPAVPAFAGQAFYAQGVLVDPLATFGVGVGLTGAAELNVSL